MSIRFSTLPSDCVQLIFDRVPTQNLLHVGLVCHAWQQHQKLNCRRRKSLIMFQGKTSSWGFSVNVFNKPFIAHNIDYNGNPRNHELFIYHNKILIPTKKSPKIQFLVETFPHLHTLIVATDGSVPKYVDSLTRFIAYYRTKLVKLQLYFGSLRHFEPHSEEILISNIMGNLLQLNSLTLLQHLTVYTEDSSQEFQIKPQTEEPIFLTRIKEFYFNVEALEKVMLAWLQKYDKAGRLGQLERYYLSTHSIAIDVRPYINKIDHIPLAKHYAFCPYVLPENFENELKRIVARFPSLITFRHSLNKLSANSLTEVISILSPLPKLIHLHLSIGSVQSTEPLELKSTPQLKSVKALDLFFDIFNSKLLQTFCQTHVPTIAQCFPNLESIQIIVQDFASFDYDSDDDSEYDSFDEDSEDDDNDDGPKLEDYAQQFFVHLKSAYGKSSLCTNFL